MSDGVEGRRRRPVAPFVVLAVALALGALFVVLAQSDSGRARAVA